MKNILLTAKYLASQEDAEHITIEHIKTALKTLEFVDADIAKEVMGYLGIDEITQQQFLTQEDLDAVAKQPKIGYDEKAKRFVKFFKSRGGYSR